MSSLPRPVSAPSGDLRKLGTLTEDSATSEHPRFSRWKHIHRRHSPNHRESSRTSREESKRLTSARSSAGNPHADTDNTVSSRHTPHHEGSSGVPDAKGSIPTVENTSNTIPSEAGAFRSQDSHYLSASWSRTRSRQVPSRGTSSGSSLEQIRTAAQETLSSGIALSDEAAQQSIHTATTRSSREDNPWSRKTLLTLDGGGVRGYSSLLILRAVMIEIEDTEKQHDPRAFSSVYPLTPRPRRLVQVDTSQRPNGSPQIPASDQTTTSNYLPCHYFDYIAGTSTGG